MQRPNEQQQRVGQLTGIYITLVAVAIPSSPLFLAAIILSVSLATSSMSSFTSGFSRQRRVPTGVDCVAKTPIPWLRVSATLNIIAR